MKSGERNFLLINWITIIGLSPIIYLFFGTIFLMTVGEWIDKLTNGWITTLLNEQNTIFITVVLIGYFISLYFIVQREKKETNKAMKQVTTKFKLGVFLIFIGHIGLGLLYALVIYGLIKGSGSISGIFLIPMILWMFFFYSIGYSIVNKQKTLERLREKNEFASST